MKLEIKDPPRSYECGFEVKRIIRDCASIELEADEQITLTASSGTECDITRKDFGYYVTPSTNGRLQRFGLRTAIVRNRLDHIFVLLVESGLEAKFDAYLGEEQMSLVYWLDSESSVREFLEKMSR